MNRPNARKEVKIEQNRSGESSRKDPRALTGAETWLSAMYIKAHVLVRRKDPRALTGAETDSCISSHVPMTNSVEKTPEPSRALKPMGYRPDFTVTEESRKDPRALTGAETRVLGNWPHS